LTHTGADGKVPAEVPLGGSVSVFHSHGLQFDTSSVVDPPDGTTVLFTVYFDKPNQPPPAKTTFHVTATPIPAGTTEIDVYSCGASGQGYSPNFVITMDNAYCTNHGASSFLAIALDKQRKPVAWGAVLDQPNTPGGDVNVQIQMGHTD